MKITIPYSLGLTVLGMCVVFIVLVFLMVIIYIMSAIIRKSTVRLTADAEAPVEAATDSVSASVAGFPAEEAVSEPGVSRQIPNMYGRQTDPSKYKMTLNGTIYDVEAVETDAKEAAYASAAHAVAAAAPKPAPVPHADKPFVPRPAPSVPVITGGGAVTAPLPGKVISVNVKPGETVKSGQVLMILEAMKMENEITAPWSGTITSIDVTSGAIIQAGDKLATIN